MKNVIRPVSLRRNRLVGVAVFCLFAVSFFINEPVFPAIRLEVLQPLPNALVSGQSVRVSGRALGARQLYVNGTPVALNHSDFSCDIQVPPGRSVIHVLSQDLDSRAQVQSAIPIFSTQTFPDLSNHWAKSEIERFVTFFQTYDTVRTYFLPDMPVTRAEVAWFLAKARTLPIQYADLSRLADVSDTYWGLPYIQSVLKSGLLQTIGKRKFIPEGLVNRVEVAQIMVQCVQPPGWKTAIASLDPAVVIKLACKYNLVPAYWASDAKYNALSSRADVIWALSKLPEVEMQYAAYYPGLDRTPGPVKVAQSSISVPTNNLMIDSAWANPDKATYSASIVTLYVKVKDGVQTAGVMVDLSDLGRLDNFELNDQGLWGDEIAGDGMYSGQVIISPNAGLGEKELTVRVIDSTGKRSTAFIGITVAILEAKVSSRRNALKLVSGT